jgi:hypothetical protein
MEREQGRKVATEEMWDYLSEGENKETMSALELSIPKEANGIPLLLADEEPNHNNKKFDNVKADEEASQKRLYIVLIRSTELCNFPISRNIFLSKSDCTNPL